MAERDIVTGLDQAILKGLFPSITRWNRLEGRPRTHHFDRALKAEVRDAMWMLSRQWQMGEFNGDDAGSPVLARACVDLHIIDQYQPADGAVRPIPPQEILEPQVEHRRLPLRAGDQYLSLDLRMAAGRRWLRLLEKERTAGLLAADYREDYRNLYAAPVPDPEAPSDAQVCAHIDAWQQAGCAGGRALDGIAILEYLDKDPAHTAADGIATAGDEAVLAALADRLRKWLADLLPQPQEGEEAWLPSRLEYSFGLSAPTGDIADDESGTEVVLRAPEYHHGTLDWHALEQLNSVRLGTPRPPSSPDRRLQTVIPAPVVFEGMPNPRWWSFEDRRTNFGQVTPDTTDLGKLMFMEFALLYSNDWSVLPWVLPVGSMAQIHGIAVTTVFDERLWIRPVQEAQTAEGWKNWSMFALTHEDDSAGTHGAPGACRLPGLLMLPTAPKVQEGDPLEEVALVRDEMANMVWAVERQIPLPSGWPRAGAEAAHEYGAHLRRLAGALAAPPPAAAPIRYRVMNEVPEQWIPFIAVHVDGSTRETQLQRAALPRLIEGQPAPEKIRPRTPLLRQNLPLKYLIHEEEVPRAGIVLSQCYQRTRRSDGSIVTWYGARKTTGRGEGSSGLAFDQLINTPPPP